MISMRGCAWRRSGVRSSCLWASATARRRGGLGLTRPTHRAWKSTSSISEDKKEIGPFSVKPNESISEEKESGHFYVKPNESILFFDSKKPSVPSTSPGLLTTTRADLFPIKLSAVLRIWSNTDRDLADLLKRFDNSTLGVMDPIRLVKRAIPADIPLKVTEILPRLKDGGAYVKVQHDASVSPSDIEGERGWACAASTNTWSVYAQLCLRLSSRHTAAQAPAAAAQALVQPVSRHHGAVGARDALDRGPVPISSVPCPGRLCAFDAGGQSCRAVRGDAI